MATGKGGSTMFWIIGSLIVVAGGIGAYFLLRKPKEDNEENTKKDADVNTGGVGGEYGGGSVTPSVEKKEYTFPFKTTEKGNKFRAWVIKKDPAFAKSIDLDATGQLNSYVQKAWDKYGQEYSASLKGTSDKSVEETTGLSKDIETIMNNAVGTKSEKTYLLKGNTDFVKTWAKAIRNKITAFEWYNQIYRTYTGDRVLDYNPINVIHYAKIDGNIAKSTADDDASAYNVEKGTNLGKVTAIKYNKGLWLYAPEESTFFKWYKSNNVTRIKPTSNFEGINDVVEFSSFDDNLDL